MTSSFKAAVLSIALLFSVPASAIGFPQLNLRNAIKGGVVALIGAGAAVYYLKTQKTESELSEKKSVRSTEMDPLSKAIETVNEFIGQEGRDDKPDYVEKSTGAIIVEKTPATGLGKVKKVLVKKVIPVVLAPYALNKAWNECIEAAQFYGLDFGSYKNLFDVFGASSNK